MTKKRARRATSAQSASQGTISSAAPEGASLPVLAPATSQFAELQTMVLRDEPPIDPRRVERGVVVFDLDGTILDDLGLIGDVAGDVLFKAFGTPAAEGRRHYLATTGMPFEAQLAQLYPQAPASLREGTARIFHQRKVTEAYAFAGPFGDVTKSLKRLSLGGWTMVISTGAEREMADLVLEREGLRFWFEAVLGSGQGTKREHLAEYRRRYPDVPFFLVGDSRFDMEVAGGSPGVVPLARASSLLGWTLSPDDLKRWGAAWADYTLADLPEVLDQLDPTRSAPPKRGRRARRAGEGRDRESPGAGGDPASV